MANRGLGTIYQVAWQVADLSVALDGWTRKSFTGPFYVFDHFDFRATQEGGTPVTLDMSIALGFSGTTSIELIQVHETTSTLFSNSDALPRLHHVARLVDDFDSRIKPEQYGIPDFTGQLPSGSRMAYFDTRDEIGCHTELVEYAPEIEELLVLMESAAEKWDGQEPVRRLG